MRKKKNTKEERRNPHPLIRGDGTEGLWERSVENQEEDANEQIMTFVKDEVRDYISAGRWVKAHTRGDTPLSRSNCSSWGKEGKK